VWCRVVSCRVVSCRVVSCRVVSCRVVSCRVVLVVILTIYLLEVIQMLAFELAQGAVCAARVKNFSRILEDGSDQNVVANLRDEGTAQGRNARQRLPEPVVWRGRWTRWWIIAVCAVVGEFVACWDCCCLLLSLLIAIATTKTTQLVRGRSDG
jgi:hypothetical protein